VNALLRRFLRERDTLLAWVDEQPAARWLFPDWLLERLRHDWPDDWAAIVTASNERPPMALRVNPLRQDRAAYLAELEAAGIGARAIPGLDHGLMLDQPRPTRELPGFADGRVSVQDSGAQLAAQLLDARPGERILDACAAPGGKTAAILERANDDLELVALDSDESRLVTLRATLERLGLSAQACLGDAADPSVDWTERPFDRILLDVPCSATGVIRRHPDIKWLRRTDDIPVLAATQERMLEAVWPLLRPGGRLLYATCSLLAEENQARIAAFLARHPEARELDMTTDWGRPMPHGRQLLPTPGGHDGFFYALLGRDAP
jgi:16S rRNA (cytosine967-C5)-methyltransferase